MNFDSLLPFLVIVGTFGLAFLLEALVLYFFKLQRSWAALGVAIAINLVCLALIFYVAIPLLGKLGYEFNGLDLPAQVVVFLWWFSAVVDGLLLSLFLRSKNKKDIYTASLIMNALSYLFLYFFVVNSH